MTTRVSSPICISTGSEISFTLRVVIVDGGTGREFYFRVGRKGAVTPWINKLMTETASTSEYVDLRADLTSSDTNSILDKTSDFQIVMTVPKQVVLEGKIELDGVIGTL